MKRCYVWKGVGLDPPNTYTYSACASNPSWGDAKGYPGYFAPYNNGIQIPSSWASTAGSITLVTSESEYKAARSGTGGNGGSCEECMGECPEGTIKCKHNKYPGYCCVPCKSTAARINDLASKIGV